MRVRGGVVHPLGLFGNLNNHKVDRAPDMEPLPGFDPAVEYRDSDRLALGSEHFRRALDLNVCVAEIERNGRVNGSDVFAGARLTAPESGVAAHQLEVVNAVATLRGRKGHRGRHELWQSRSAVARHVAIL